MRHFSKKNFCELVQFVCKLVKLFDLFIRNCLFVQNWILGWVIQNCIACMHIYMNISISFFFRFYSMSYRSVPKKKLVKFHFLAHKFEIEIRTLLSVLSLSHRSKWCSQGPTLAASYSCGTDTGSLGHSTAGKIFYCRKHQLNIFGPFLQVSLNVSKYI